MRDFRKRIAALELKEGPGVTRWRRVTVDGQSKVDALAAYERRHGTIGTTGTDGVIYRVIVDPISIKGEGALQ